MGCREKVVATDPKAKMADVNLRKAMWAAVDNDTVGKKFYSGLRWNATTLIPPSHPNSMMLLIQVYLMIQKLLRRSWMTLVTNLTVNLERIRMAVS